MGIVDRMVPGVKRRNLSKPAAWVVRTTEQPFETPTVGLSASSGRLLLLEASTTARAKGLTPGRARGARPGPVRHAQVRRELQQPNRRETTDPFEAGIAGLEGYSPTGLAVSWARGGFVEQRDQLAGGFRSWGSLAEDDLARADSLGVERFVGVVIGTQCGAF